MTKRSTIKTWGKITDAAGDAHKEQRDDKTQAEGTLNTPTQNTSQAYAIGSSGVSRHPNYLKLSRGSDDSVEAIPGARDARMHVADAGIADNDITGMGTGASDIGTGGAGVSDDEILSEDDPRILANANAPDLIAVQRYGSAAAASTSGEYNDGSDQIRRGNASQRQVIRKASRPFKPLVRTSLRQKPARDLPVVAAFFDDWNAASRAVEELYRSNYSDTQIGLVRRDRDRSQLNRSGALSHGQERAKNVAGGIITGAAVGGVVGLLATLASLTIPGLGPVVVGGVLAGTGIGAGIGATAGGLTGALNSVGLSEDEAKPYEAQLRRGVTLVTVRAGLRNTDAWHILQHHGAHTYEPTDDVKSWDDRD